MTSEDRMAELGIELPVVGEPRFTYVPVRRAGDIVYISGQVPRLGDGTFLKGKLGADSTVEEGQEAARLCGLHLLALAKTITGSLDDVEFMKVFGMVNATADFRDHPAVIEGCSKILVAVLGERGRHARSAVGMASLPSNVRVEIEAVIRVLA